MHWSTTRALNTITQQRHQQLDQQLNEAMHRDTRGGYRGTTPHTKPTPPITPGACVNTRPDLPDRTQAGHPPVTEQPNTASAKPSSNAQAVAVRYQPAQPRSIDAKHITTVPATTHHAGATSAGHTTSTKTHTPDD